MNYAPIGLTVYRRHEHLKLSVEQLKKNIFADKSDLYIFSDGPKQGDEEKVDAVRKYIRTISGFKTVQIIERKTNSRIDNNRGGAKYLLKKYGKMIWLAEDVLCAPGFLSFANSALEKYANISEVNSISGYVEPFEKPLNYKFDAFFTRRFNGWGFAIWEDRYLGLPDKIHKAEYHSLINDKQLLREFKYYIGEDAINMLKNEVNGEIDALDVRTMYHQFINKRVTIRPVKSLTANIGFDGSGTHCNISNRFDVETWGKADNFILPDAVIVNDEFAEPLSNFRSIGKMPRKKIPHNLKWFVTRITNWLRLPRLF